MPNVYHLPAGCYRMDYLPRGEHSPGMGLYNAHGKDPLSYIAILLVVEWFQREKQFGLQIEEKGIFRYQAVRWTLYYVLFITTLLLAGQQEEFIYFQF